MQQAHKAGTWYVGQWGLWGWIETILKVIAIGVGIYAFLDTLPLGNLVIANHPHLVAVILLALFTLAYAGVIVLRFRQHEIISLVFSILNFLGHAALLLAILNFPSMRRLPLVFCGFYILGQLAKFVFLNNTKYTEVMQTPANMMRFNVLHTAAYVVLAIAFLP